MRPLSTDEYDPALDEPLPVRPALRSWVRATLVALALGVSAVFAIALYLNPYRDGETWRMGTHQQLGLPPCTFVLLTKGYPCPSCGMTTSFSLLAHGDPLHSLQANCVGTFLATLCAAFVPWAVVCAARGRPLVIVSMEQTLCRLVVIFVTLMLLRWFLVLTLLYFGYETYF